MVSAGLKYLEREISAVRAKYGVARNICPRCELKNFCYRSRYEWEEFRDDELLSIKENCPIRKTVR